MSEVRKRVIKGKMGVDLPVELLDELDAYHRENKVHKNVIVELALRRFFASEKESAGE